MALKVASGSGNWSSAATWYGGVPAVGDDIVSNGFTVNVDQNINVGSLGNYAASRTVATTQMTNNNSPAPYAVAASSVNGTNEPFRAFDRSVSYTAGFYWGSAANTGWISYDFATGTVIDGYTIYGFNNSTYNPQNWTFQGSNDNTNWTTLHTVTLASPIANSGNYSINTIGNSTAYRYYRINVTLNGGAVNLIISEIELYQPGTSAAVAGGGFNFNTAGVTASITGATPLAVGAANLLTFSHNTGTVTTNLTNNTSAVFSSGILSSTITYSGNGDLIFTCPNINPTITLNNTNYLTKTGAGTLTINGNLTLNVTGNPLTIYLLNSTNGNVTVNGNVAGSIGGTNSPYRTILQSAGNLTITGNVTPPTTINNIAVNFTGTSLTINGNLVQGSGNNVSSTGTTIINGDIYGNSNASTYGLSTSGVTTITGNVIGNIGAAVISSNTLTVNGNVSTISSAAGISSTSANIITVNGNISASSAANGISCTNVGAQLILSGSLYNTNGKQAAYVANLLANQSAPMVAQFFTPGLQNITMYSQDTLANYPSASNVRQGTVYGVASGSTGTLAIPSATDVRSGVTYDATTTGSGLFTTALLLSEISSSNVAVAARLRNAGTTEILGNLLAAYKK